MLPTMKDKRLVGWRRRAARAKSLAGKMQDPFAKRVMKQVATTYKWLAKTTARCHRGDTR